jgi:hypothetical protein
MYDRPASGYRARNSLAIGVKLPFYYYVNKKYRQKARKSRKIVKNLLKCSHKPI